MNNCNVYVHFLAGVGETGLNYQFAFIYSSEDVGYFWMTLNIFNCSSGCMTDQHKIRPNNIRAYVIIRNVVAVRMTES